MLLLDFSQILIANLHVSVGLHQAREVEPDLLKHMALNTIRSIRSKFPADKYGEIIIACDDRSWRKKVYPYYKAARATAKEKSDLDWNAIFAVFNQIKDDLKNFFPYRVVQAEGAEADDVIGTLVQQFGSEGLAVGEDILIMSGDKDFAQLHRFANVKQYDPVKKKYITHNAPEEFLLEHIIKGDPGDGVPNVLSDDDTFVVPGKRQKPMTQKRMAEMKEIFATPQYGGADDMLLERIRRNNTMVDLRNTPPYVREGVLASYKQQAGKGRSHIFNYLMTNRMRNLMESIGDF